MEVTSLRAVREQLRNAVAVIYSLIVMATIIPGFPTTSNLVEIPYYIFVPGYFTALLLHQTDFLERLFYSVAWSITILASAYSLQSIGVIQHLPLQLIIPAFTIILLAYDHFHR